MDLRVGGRWIISDTRGGVVYTALGEYLEVDRPRRLTFTFGMPQFSPEVATVTVEIAAEGAGARMTMIQTKVRRDAEADTREGWNWMFVGLEDQLRQSGQAAAGPPPTA